MATRGGVVTIWSVFFLCGGGMNGGRVACCAIEAVKEGFFRGVMGGDVGCDFCGGWALWRGSRG